jgi:hypothetical protein
MKKKKIKRVRTLVSGKKDEFLQSPLLRESLKEIKRV